MVKKHIIKNPTIRKVRNRGFEPVNWHHGEGVASGWIWKTGRKYLYFYAPSTGNKRVPLAERANMRAI